MQTYWNGEPTKVDRVIVRIPKITNPKHWAYQLQGQERPAVVVHYPGGSPFILDNIDGQGWHKVTTGKGSPQAGHKQLSDDTEILRPDDIDECRCGMGFADQDRDSTGE